MTGLKMRFLLCGVALVALAACAPSIPESGAGVGFEDYDSYQERARRDAALQGRSIPAPVAVREGPIPDDRPDAIDAARAALADPAAAERNSGQLPLEASPSNPPPQVVTNAAGISDENDFTAVSDERSIDADAALIARNRAQYEVIQPTALPTRPGTDTPNIVEYALRTSNPKGVPIFRRTGFNAEAKAQRNCAAYGSADLAQEDFLSLGGPQKDRKGLDPDGDGYACDWDPAPFRAVRAGN